MPTYNGLRESRYGPSSMTECVACPGNRPVSCRANSHNDQPFHPTKATTSTQPSGTRHPPRSTGSPHCAVATQPAMRGAPTATGGQSRNATVSSEPCTIRPLSRARGAPPDRQWPVRRAPAVLDGAP